MYYVQYAHARICSVLRGWREDYDLAALREVDLSPLHGEQAQALMLLLAKYPEMLTAAAQGNAPHDVTFYLRELASAYHSYYDAERILVDDEAIKLARLALVAATAQVLANGLAMLGGVCAPAHVKPQHQGALHATTTTRRHHPGLYPGAAGGLGRRLCRGGVRQQNSGAVSHHGWGQVRPPRMPQADWNPNTALGGKVTPPPVAPVEVKPEGVAPTETPAAQATASMIL